jgi:predicted nucleotide-binding protein
VEVFIGWSGEKGRRVANVLRDSLPGVVQAIEPSLGPAEAELGTDWRLYLKEALNAANAGIICVTMSGQDSLGLQFEANELVRSVGSGNVILLLVDLRPDELHPSLASLEYIQMDTAGIRRMFDRLARLANPDRASEIPERRLEEVMAALSLAAGEITVHVTGTRHRIGGARRPGATKPNVDEARLAALDSKVDKLISVVEILKDRVVVGQTPGPASGPLVQASNLSDDERPTTMFIGSSTEGRDIAEAIQLELEGHVECTLWTQDVFRPNLGFFETLVNRANEFDVAVIVMTPDDVLVKRGVETKAPRDNLIFEIGLFTGRLTRARAFIVHPNDEPIEFPSDFEGVNRIAFRRARSDRNLQAAVGPACTQIKRAMGIWNQG